MKLAAIDIGSNAVRLLFYNVYEHQKDAIFKKETLLRIPLRLGEDAFLYQEIKHEKIDKLIKTMAAFKLLIDIHGTDAYMACATSAMREAQNGQTIVEQVKQQTGIDIQIIDGKVEADLIFSNHIAEKLDKKSSYLYIDVGGGSTELTFFHWGQKTSSKSFNIGTLRILHQQVSQNTWTDLANWIQIHKKIYKNIIAIGSGGNINKTFKMSEQKEGKPLSFEKIKSIYDNLRKYTYQERMEILGLNHDRADVIIPALEIYLFVMKQADIKHIIVPKIGLADGIIHYLYEQRILTNHQ